MYKRAHIYIRMLKNKIVIIQKHLAASFHALLACQESTILGHDLEGEAEEFDEDR